MRHGATYDRTRCNPLLSMGKKRLQHTGLTPAMKRTHPGIVAIAFAVANAAFKVASAAAVDECARVLCGSSLCPEASV